MSESRPPGAAGRGREARPERSNSGEIAERIAAGALVLLALALHLRDLTIGFPNEDLAVLDVVLRTNLGALLGGGALPGSFTPLSRELWLWWWGKSVGLGAPGFHVMAAAWLAAALWLAWRLAEAWDARRTSWLAAGALLAFPPLGAIVSSAPGSRDLIAVGVCALTLWTYTRRRPWVAGLMAGAAVATRETAAVLPFALLILDRRLFREASLRERIRRLAPASVAAAVVLVWLFTRSPWPLSFSPREALGGLVTAWYPQGTRAGLGSLWRAAPWLVLGVVALAAAAVPFSRRELPRETAREASAPGIALLAAALLPLAFLRGPLRSEIFAVPSLGLALALGPWLARRPPWLARAILAAGALVSLGANSAIMSGSRFTSHARLAVEASNSAPVLEALRPLRGRLAATPIIFVAGVPPESTYRWTLGAGARVLLHQPALSVRFLAEMTPAEAASPFGLLRYDRVTQQFRFERANAQVRARIGEGALVFGRYEVAAAAFASAARERPDDPELPYPWVLSLAAAGRPEEAREQWKSAVARDAFPVADTLAAHLLVGLVGAGADSARRDLRPFAAAVLADPLSAAPHLDLGRRLLVHGRARSAAIELSAACGIGKRSQDFYWLAQAYDGLGSFPEALEAYRAALAGGLDSTTYRRARRRFGELLSGPAGQGRR